MVLIINYALRNRLKDYAPFFATIKGNCNQWWHFLESTFIVSTDSSADEFAKLLYPHIEATDALLVARLQKDHQGWLQKEAWDWLNDKNY
jgi:hypothetical protein